MRRTVLKDYTAQYQDPVAARAGERLRAVRQDGQYPGWWWCLGPDGKEGWVPEAWLTLSGPEAVLRRDYDARELSARAGETVTVLEQVAGWSRVTSQAGQTGWLPTHCLGES